MIAHESDIGRLPDGALKKHGFARWKKNPNGHTHGLKLDAIHALLYDSSGFLTWKRRVGSTSRLEAVILIPEPVRTEADLKRIVESVRRKIREMEKYRCF